MTDPNDPELNELEQEEAEAEREGRKKMAWAFGIVTVVAVIALAIAAKSCTGTRRDAKKLTVENAVAKFEKNPVDAELAKAAAAELEAAGKKKDAEALLAKHEAAVAGGDKNKEGQLRAALEANPADDAALGQLVEVYVKRKDVPGAKKVYEEFLAKAPSAKRHGNFGSWLYRNSQFEPAAKEALARGQGRGGRRVHPRLPGDGALGDRQEEGSPEVAGRGAGDGRRHGHLPHAQLRARPGAGRARRRAGEEGEEEVTKRRHPELVEGPALTPSVARASGRASGWTARTRWTSSTVWTTSPGRPSPPRRRRRCSRPRS
ncbi:MAG: hypothetical protein QM765_44840 [Myxococcales bacterium]